MAVQITKKKTIEGENYASVSDIVDAVLVAQAGWHLACLSLFLRLYSCALCLYRLK